MNETLKEGLSALLVGILFYAALIIGGFVLENKWIEWAQQARQEYATKRQQALQGLFGKPSKEIMDYYKQKEDAMK